MLARKQSDKLHLQRNWKDGSGKTRGKRIKACILY